MISQSLLDMLVCPENKMPVELAEPSFVEALNIKIKLKQVVTRKGVPVMIPLDAGLVRKDGLILYPIRNQIPIMLVDESIPLLSDPD